MKRFNTTAMAVLIALTGAVPSFAQDMQGMKAEHERLAAHYEQLAQEQEALIEEHTKMMADKTMFLNPKATMEQRRSAMEQHCKRIIENAKLQRDEFRGLAEWHRESAGLI